MSFHPQIPAAPEDASADSASAEVREIYPGARQATPVRSVSPRRRRTSIWRGSEAGMATMIVCANGVSGRYVSLNPRRHECGARF